MEVSWLRWPTEWLCAFSFILGKPFHIPGRDRGLGNFTWKDTWICSKVTEMSGSQAESLKKRAWSCAPAPWIFQCCWKRVIFVNVHASLAQSDHEKLAVPKSCHYRVWGIWQMTKGVIYEPPAIPRAHVFKKGVCEPLFRSIWKQQAPV